jgi:hypothetical protein
MNELNNFLSNFETRIDADGNEVSKPDVNDDFYRDATGVTENYSIDISHYHNATKVIKLPDWKAFVIKANNKIATCQLKGNFSLISDYCASMNLKPTIDMFVPWKDGEVMEEPADPNTLDPQPELTNHIVNEMYVKLEEYQTAQSKIQFFGWEVDRVSESGTVVLINGNTTIVFSPCQVSIVDEDFIVQHVIKTIDDLNRECQLYKIVN